MSGGKNVIDWSNDVKLCYWDDTELSDANLKSDACFVIMRDM